MLILTRVENESIYICPKEDIDPSMTIADLFADDPIKIMLTDVKHGKVRLGVKAPNNLEILRSELLEK